MGRRYKKPKAGKSTVTKRGRQLQAAGTFLNTLSARTVPGGGVAAKAIIDAAAHIHHLANYWADAEDRYTVDIASSSERATMRGRSIHAALNSGYIRNAIRAFGNHTIGSGGPQMRIMKFSGLSREERSALEWEFFYWRKRTGDLAKLRQIPRAFMFYGESLERFIYDPYIENGNLNIQQIEPRRLDYPMGAGDERMVDGILFDGIHPLMYYIEKRNVNPIYQSLEYEPVPADHIMHLFLSDFADQKRGIPIIATVLRLQAETMLWEAHTLGAADWAARWGGFIRTTATLTPEDVMEIPGDTMLAPTPGTAVFTPEGWGPEQIKAEFPTANFEGFANALHREQGAGLGVPFGVMGADTSDYSYSSWRGERQNYWTYIEEVQDVIRDNALDPRFQKWIECYSTGWRTDPVAEIALKLLEKYGDPARIPITWQFPHPPSADPEKDARANEINLRNHVTSLHKVIEKEGMDYDEIMEELLEEARDLAKLIPNIDVPPNMDPAENA